MGKRIEVTQYGNIHYHAFCEECDWDAAIHTDKTFSTGDVRNAARRHVIKTGHEVTIESGKATRYKLLERIT